jgi:hypothetical protein
MIINPDDKMNYKVSTSNKDDIAKIKQNIDNIKLNIALKYELLRDTEHITEYI